MSGARVLITGATGYVGARVARRLLQVGHRIEALLRTESDASALPSPDEALALHRITTPAEAAQVVAATRPDVVIHIAALVRGQDAPEDVSGLIEANVELGTQLLAGLAATGGRRSRFLNTGSFWEEIDAAGTTRPMNLYAATKAAFEQVLAYHVDAYPISALTLRLFHTYGPADPRPKVFRHFARSVGAASPVPFSPGEQLLDLVHIDDVVCAYEAAVSRLLTDPPLCGEVIEIGTGAPVTLRALAEAYAAAKGVELNIGWGASPYRPREPMARSADPTAAKELLGWEPRVLLADGLPGV